MHLRGFDRRGAAACICEASATGFKAYGVFRDAADFAVVMLYDADDFFEHPRMKYLPDFDFSGMVLTFDLLVDGLEPIESPKYNWIDWATLDVIREDGSTAKIPLFDYATQQAGDYLKASAVFSLVGTPVAYDRVSLWYQNIAFDFIVGSPPESAAAIVTWFQNAINWYDWAGAGVLIGLEAVASGTDLTVTAARAGYDGSMVGIYALAKNANLYFSPSAQKLSGGSSEATWRVEIDFTARGIDSIRQAWLTLAPRLADSEEYVDTEWTGTFTNWGVTDPNGKRPLKVAGAGSVRVDSRDKWASYSGSGWAQESGWYNQGWARRSGTPGDKVTVKYHCQHAHELYVGTSLYTDRAMVAVRLDGDAPTSLDCYLDAEPAVVTRRKLRTAVAAGMHTVEITVGAGGWFYFDFIEAAVLGDVPDAAETYSDVAVATDFDTDHSYKLTPQRLVWNLDKLGFRARLNHYVGVFWWNQRVRVGATWKTWTVTFGGTWADGDAAFLVIGGTTMGKSVFPADTVSTIAAHFAYFINEIFVGVWAEATAGELKVHVRTPEWGFTYSTSKSSAAGTISESGGLDEGVEGTWQIDTSAPEPINWAAKKWHADFFAAVAGKGWGAVSAFSMELVDPPDAPPGAAWAARYLDDVAVQTETGFAALKSTHCAFSDVVVAYQKAAYKQLAGLMNAAGLTPWLQFGEFLWWFFSNYNGATNPDGGMAFYDAYTEAAALAALGRDLAHFILTTDDPAVNSYADANFLRGRIKAHIDAIRAEVLGTYAGTKFELLWPYDVNYPVVTASGLGGRLNRYVNLPSEYEQKSGSGLDALKVEGLAFGVVERHLDRARETVRFPWTAPCAWAKGDVRYLVPWFNGGCPWREEYLIAGREQGGGAVFWAWDHLCLLGWPLPLPAEERRAVYRAAA